MKIRNSIIEFLLIPLKNSNNSIGIIIFRIIDGVLPSLFLISSAKVIDSIIIFRVSDDNNILIAPIIFLLFIICYGWLSGIITSTLAIRLENDIRSTFKINLIGKISLLKYEYFEDQKYADKMSRITRDIELNIKNGFLNIINYFALIIQVIGLIVILSSYLWWLGLIVVGMIVSLAIISFINGKVIYKADIEVEKNIRKYNYSDSLITDRDTVSERTMFSYKDYVQNMFSRDYEVSRRKQFKAFTSYFFKVKLGSIFTVLVAVIVIAILVIPLKEDMISLGVFMASTTALLSFVKIGTSQLTSYTKQFSKDKLFIEDLSCLFDWEEYNVERGIDIDNEFKSIQFLNVSFKYPNTEQIVIKDLNLLIEKGKSYSFVGVNGAGKSTIIKLLLGFYDNYTGKILINGHSLKEINRDSLYNLYSVIFQDYSKFAIQVNQNIVLNDNNKDNDYMELINRFDLTDMIKSLPNGINTNLGKILPNSSDISEGQWQKLSIIRGFQKKSDLMILDEPTSSLDPIMESKIYKDYWMLTKGKTSILISHRLGSTMITDHIFVLENGSLIESGNHKELMLAKGKYCEMFELQRSWYL